MPIRQTLALLLLCSLSNQALSQVYTWVDEKGQKHFSSQPPAAQQSVEAVTIKQGYAGEGRTAVPTAPVEVAGEAVAGKVSRREMCQSAMRWTAIDLQNLREIAQERQDAGRITAAEYEQVQTNLAGAEQRITLQDCLTSSAEEQQRYECLSKGAGVLACSGLLSAAMDEAEKEARARTRKP
ncbi:DUF4124 domain-containing protein [Phytopseudomonas punonensis]|uniref:DUF4124 domain-containing protein n=1 Tax=Phytopseudomonas punonensis TaxID=1220495 RepID=A0A1M7CLK9_9GAMM|nr:DUF4124 domain-containing protein [Pseudomonas punonensis]SHL68115.1 protein of unknown function [Pseudomonas punonensis]